MGQASVCLCFPDHGPAPHEIAATLELSNQESWDAATFAQEVHISHPGLARIITQGARAGSPSATGPSTMEVDQLKVQKLTLLERRLAGSASGEALDQAGPKWPSRRRRRTLGSLPRLLESVAEPEAEPEGAALWEPVKANEGPRDEALPWKVHEFLAEHGFKGIDDMQFIGSVGMNYSFPLHRAVKVRNAEVVQMLLCARADASAVDSKGRTPFQYAMSKDLYSSHQSVLAAFGKQQGVWNRAP